MRSSLAGVALLAAAGLGVAEANAAHVDITFYGNGPESYHDYEAPFYLQQSSSGAGGTGWALGDLSTGQLKATAQASAANPQMTAIVAGLDSFTVHAAGQSNVSVTASLHVDGTGLIPTGGNTLSVYTYIQQGIGGGPTDSFNHVWQAMANPIGAYQVAFNQTWSISASPTITFTVPVDTPFDLVYSLRLDTMMGAVADFSDTASLSFDLPPGAIIESSGAYVPEPSGVAGLLLGTMVLLRRAHRQRHCSEA